MKKSEKALKCFLQRAADGVRAAESANAEWASEGKRKRLKNLSMCAGAGIPVNKSQRMLVREKRVCFHIKPGGTTGSFLPSQQLFAGTGFFAFISVLLPIKS